MLAKSLPEILRYGENSGVEFKRDHLHPDELATEIAALLNLEGGMILLGVEDDGRVSGLRRPAQEVESWVMNVCRNNLQPPVIPYWEVIPWENDLTIGIITLSADSPDKPYKARRGQAWITYVRVGSTSRPASREEESRLYQASHLMRYDIKAVSGAGLSDLDLLRVQNYFRDILGQDCPAAEDEAAWKRILLNMDFMVESNTKTAVTVAGLLLFGARPHRYLPQAGITATAYPGTIKDYATTDEEVIRGPVVSLFSPGGAGRAGGENWQRVVDAGVIDRALSFVNRNMGVTAWLEGGRRVVKKDYPIEAVREAIVNAVAHRDYTIAVTDIELSLYSDRLEIISPGNLPNTVTVEKMRQGYRAARNELLKDVLRDYGYVEFRGMGVRERILRGMREHNGTEPELIEEEARFTVRLRKGAG